MLVVSNRYISLSNNCAVCLVLMTACKTVHTYRLTAVHTDICDLLQAVHTDICDSYVLHRLPRR